MNNNYLSNGKILKALLSTMLMVWLGSNVFAQGNYVVKDENVGVREGASMNSTIIGILNKGDEVKVRSFHEEWAKIDFNHRSGFVLRKSIKPSLVLAQETDVPAEKGRQPLTRVTGDGSNDGNVRQPLTRVDETSPSAGSGQQNITRVDRQKSNEKELEQTSASGENRHTSAINVLLGGKNFFNRKSSYNSSVLVEFVGGNCISTSSFFYHYGLGLAFGHAHTASYYGDIDVSNWGISIPVQVGYLFGKENDLHLSLKGGVNTNFLVNSKLNKENQKIKFKDRFGWTGGLRATLGYGLLSLSAEFHFPISGEGKGAFLFGVTLGI